MPSPSGVLVRDDAGAVKYLRDCALLRREEMSELEEATESEP